jgi:hypothetical protein
MTGLIAPGEREHHPALRHAVGVVNQVLMGLAERHSCQDRQGFGQLLHGLLAMIAGPVASLRIDGPTVAAGGASRLGNVLHHITLE